MSILFSDLERTLSAARLAPYRTGARDDTETICRYIWNMELSQALSPTLHSVEVALRNAIHVAGATHFGSVEWLRDSAMLRLERREQQMLDGAVNDLWREQGHDVRLIRQGRIPPLPPPRIDDHIATLTFGFWTGLLNAPYQVRLWDTRPGGINLSAAVFPHTGRRNQQRAIIFPMMNRVRHLRNRVSHYEPIWNWQPSLAAQHQEAIMLLGWITPALRDVTALIDQFPVIQARSLNYYAALVQLTT